MAVLLACVGVMLFWRVTEDEQNQKDELTRKLADAEIGRRRFTSDMLVNLARRNQSMLYRQLEIINQLEESERNPDALAELFRLDHLTTRVRRNAENLLVLSGEKPPRVWSQPVPLRDVVRAAIAETEDLDRVAFEIPEGPLVDGASVTDLTHLLAELTENAVRFSPPDMAVTVRGRRDPRGGQGQLLTVEDWGVGMEEADLAAANALLADPPEIDLSVSKRLGFHVVARLAARHGIRVVLSPTPGSGITASVALPGSLFELGPEPVGALAPAVPAPRPPGRADRRRAPGRPAATAAQLARCADRAAPAGPARRRRPLAASRRRQCRRSRCDRPETRGTRTSARPMAGPTAAVAVGTDEPRPADPGTRGAHVEGRPAWAPIGRSPGARADGTATRPDGAGGDGSHAADPRGPPAATPRPRAVSRHARRCAGACPRPTSPPDCARHSAAEPADPGPLPVAAEALSRYQASRAAARSARRRRRRALTSGAAR